MKKAAGTVKKTTTAGDDLEQYLAVFNARKQFLVTAGNMSWQLAVTVIVPVFIGVQLDKHFKSAPSYTLAALFLSFGLAAWLVWKTVKDVRKSQAEADQEDKS